MTFPVLKEDQWDRYPEGNSPPLAFPPHIPPQGGGGLYRGLQVGFLKFTKIRTDISNESKEASGSLVRSQPIPDPV